MFKPIQVLQKKKETNTWNNIESMNELNPSCSTVDMLPSQAVVLPVSRRLVSHPASRPSDHPHIARTSRVLSPVRPGRPGWMGREGRCCEGERSESVSEASGVGLPFRHTTCLGLVDLPRNGQGWWKKGSMCLGIGSADMFSEEKGRRMGGTGAFRGSLFMSKAAASRPFFRGPFG